MRRKQILLLLLVVLAFLLPGCNPEKKGRPFAQLKVTESMQLDFATQFSVDYYEGGYKMLSLADGSRFFIVPEGALLPEGADQDTGRYSGRLFSAGFYDRAEGQSNTASCKRVVSERSSK